MIPRLTGKWRRLRWRWKAPIWGISILLGLALLYVLGRSLQYLSASRASAGIFEPEGADAVIRMSGAGRHWDRIQATDFWKVLRRKILKDAAVRTQVDELLTAAGAPTLDQLDDVRWLETHPMMREESILRFAGRDLLLALKDTPRGIRFCAATRVGWRDFLLLPGASIAPGLAGFTKETIDGRTVLRQGALHVAIQGAVVVASDDPELFRSALRRKGTPEPPSIPFVATFRAADVKPHLDGFPAGGFLAFADFEGLTRIRLEADVDGNWTVVAEGTTIGHKRIARFAPVTGRRLRVSITKARACPTISTVGVYRSPGAGQA